jgi:carbon-monoxide dehydrogenase medium subunit
MKAPDFDYLRPESLDAALQALAAHPGEAMVLAGGQSLMALHNLRLAQAGVLVDINRVPGLDGIRDAGDHVAIGCMARYAALEASEIVHRHLPLFAQALPHVAHHAIRNRGTLGGSLALADPAAELPACCLALEARLAIAGAGGTREVSADAFFLGLYETALRPGELLLEVRIPKPSPSQLQRFAEVARRRGDFAIAGLALRAERDGPRLSRVRLAMLGVSDRPCLAGTAMALLEGAAWPEVDAAALAAALDADLNPPADPAYPPAYRRQVVKVLLRRMLEDLGDDAS